MDKKFLIMIGLILLVLPLINSQLIFARYTAVNLSIPCAFNNSECSNDAICNYSIFNPKQERTTNGTVKVDEKSFFPILINESNVSELGEYRIDMFCADQNYYDSATIKFKITPDGDELTIPRGIVYIIFYFVVMLIFILTIYGAVKIPWKNRRNDEGKVISINDLKWVKLGLMVFAYLEFLYLIAMTNQITENFMYSDNASYFFNTVYTFLLIIFYCIIVILPWIVLFMVIADKKTKKLLERGIPMR